MYKRPSRNWLFPLEKDFPATVNGNPVAQRNEP